MSKLKQQLGLSLVELTVVLAITGLISVPLTAIFRLQLRIPAKVAAEVSTTRQIQKATLLLIEDARSAQSFTPGINPVYGTFAWNELAGPDPIPVTSLYKFEAGKIEGSTGGIFTGGELIQTGAIPFVARLAVSAAADGSAFTVAADGGGTPIVLDSNTPEVAPVRLSGTDYKLSYSQGDQSLTFKLNSDGSAVGTLTLPRILGRMVRILDRGGEITPEIVILNGLVSYSQVQFVLTEPGWGPILDETGKIIGFEYTDGKIVVNITQIHEAGAEFGDVISEESLVADFRPHEEREVSRPPLSGVQPSGDSH